MYKIIDYLYLYGRLKTCITGYTSDMAHTTTQSFINLANIVVLDEAAWIAQQSSVRHWIHLENWLFTATAPRSTHTN